jgi:hypothetical protein
MKKIEVSQEGQGVIAWTFCSVAAAMLIGVISLFL